MIFLLLGIINTGAISIDGGNIILNGVSFSQNFITKPTNNPNIRHNVFVSNGAIVNIIAINVDNTNDSNFVYISDDGSKSEVSELIRCLFIGFFFFPVKKVSFFMKMFFFYLFIFQKVQLFIKRLLSSQSSGLSTNQSTNDLCVC
jgi:hypothetical protein